MGKKKKKRSTSSSTPSAIYNDDDDDDYDEEEESMTTETPTGKINFNSPPRNPNTHKPKSLSTPRVLRNHNTASSSPQQEQTCSMLKLQLTPRAANSTKSSSKLSATTLPQIILNEKDASTLNNIQQNEPVIVIVSSNNNNDDEDYNIRKTLICKVALQNNNSNSSSSSSTPKLVSSGGKQKYKHLNTGYCELLLSPSMIQSWLIRDDSDYDKEDGNSTSRNMYTPTTKTPPSVTTPQLMTPTPTKGTNLPSSSSSKFSFALGGGGDALITPPQQQTPKNTTPNNESSQKRTKLYSFLSIWVIPLYANKTDDNPLRKQILQLLCKRIHTIKIIRNPNLLVPKQQQDTNLQLLLKRLILAHYVQPYPINLSSSSSSLSTTNTTNNQSLTISFQGKPLHLDIHSIMDSSSSTTVHDKANTSEKQKTTLDNLEEEFDKTLQIREKGEDDEKDRSNRRLLQSLQRMVSNNNETNKNLLLYKFTPKTNILFVNDDHPKEPSHPLPTTTGRSGGIQPTTTTTTPLTTPLLSSTPITTVSKGSSTSIPQQQQQHVAGLSPILQKVNRLVRTSLFFLDKEKMMRNTTQLPSPSTFIRPPKGILLYGPSGVGKTSLAKQVIADITRTTTNSNNNTNNDIQYKYINCASLQSYTSHVGEAEKRLVSLWNQDNDRPRTTTMNRRTGSSKRKTLLVLDDIHFICSRRGSSSSSGNPSSDKLAATLLALMDGIDSKTKKRGSSPSSAIFIIAITNTPTLLDPALRRPGRLDIEIEIPIPEDVSVRLQIIKFQLQQIIGTTNTNNTSHQDSVSNSSSMKDDHSIHNNDFIVYKSISELLSLSLNDDDDESLLTKLAKQAKGFTGADCMLAIKEAIRIMILRNMNHTSNDTNTNHPSSSPSLSLGLLFYNDLQIAIRNIKPSSIKSVSVEIPKVLWSDIGGMFTVKQQLKEATVELHSTNTNINHTNIYNMLNIPLPRGILLYGPPGCSKTLMARALATEGHMNFLAVKGPELLSKWLGESERALASLFKRARMASPCIIFFDEIDAIASKRDNGGDNSGGGSRLLSQLLTELDGITSTTTAISSRNNNGSSSDNDANNKNQKPPQQQQQRVVVIGATNRPDLLDDALMRPGRIDKKIHVGIPDELSRIKIFELGLKNKACSDEIDIPRLASDELSKGFSGAELIAICRDAAFLALEEADNESSMEEGKEQLSPTIQMRHLLEAISTMDRQITPDMLEFYDSFSHTNTTSY